MTRIIPLTATFLLSAGFVDAAVCQVRAVKQQQPAIVFQQPFVLPSYYPSLGQGTDSEDLKDIKKLLQQILEELRTGGGGPAPAGDLSMQAIATQACAQCHTEGAAKGDFVLVGKDGKLVADLTRGDKRAIYARTMIKADAAGKYDPLKMPPQRVLSKASLKVIEDWTSVK